MVTESSIIRRLRAEPVQGFVRISAYALKSYMR